MSVYELQIDGSAAEAGSKRIVKSFTDIKAAAEAMEKGTKSSFDRMASAYKVLSNLKSPSSTTINGLREFSAAINSFKGPSAAALQNLKNFFGFLKSVSGIKLSGSGSLKSFLDPLNNFKGPSKQAADATRTLLKAASAFTAPTSAGLNQFLATLTGFKGPSGASAKNVRTLLAALTGFTAPRIGSLSSFLTALSDYKGPSGASAKNTRTLLNALTGFTAPRTGASLTGFLAALGSYKGPAPTAGRNTLSLLQAIASFTPPKNIGGTARSFIDLANAIDRAAHSMASLRQNAKGSLPGPTSKNAAAVRDLGKSYSFLETAVFRTNTAINALGGILGIKFLANASNEVVRIRAQLEAATGSVQQARVQFEFIKESANKLGLEFTTVAKSYGMLLGSIKGTNVTFGEAQQIFTGFSTAARALQLSTEDVDGVFRALGQIMSKGKLQAEELRGQLGDRLPGAFVRFAKALDMTKPGQLDDALKKGAISGDKLKKAILEVANTMQTEFAVSADKASKTVDSAFNRLKNSFTFSAAEFGANGFNEALISLADSLRKLLASDSLNAAASGLAGVLKFVGNNIEGLASIAGGIAVASFGKWVIGAVTATNSAKALTSTLVLVRNAMAGSTAAQMAMGLGSVGAAATKATIAFRGLNMVMKASVFGLVAAGIAAVIYGLNQVSTKSTEAAKATKDFGSNTADLQNIYDAYIAKIHDSTGALDGEIKKTKELAWERVRASQAALTGNEVVRFTSRRGLSGKVEDYLRGDVLTDQREKSLVGRLVTKRGTVAGINTDQDMLKRIDAQGAIVARYGKELEGLSEGGKKAFQQSQALVQNYREGQRLKGRSPELEKILGTRYGDYNKDTMPPGISGEAPEKPDKKGAAAAKAFESDIDRAIRAFEELDRKIAGSRSVVNGFLDSTSSAIAAQARAVAVEKVEDIENAFDPKKRTSGIMAVAKAMGVEADSYDKAKAALVAKYAAQSEAEARSQNNRAVAENIANLREENAVRTKHMGLVIMGGSQLREASREMEIEKQLLGTSADMRDKLTVALRDQLVAQQRLNDAEKVSQAVNSAMTQSSIDTKVGSAYGKGFSPDDLEAYRDLLTTFSELKDSGMDAGTVKYLTELKRAQIAQSQALKEVAAEYEGIRQLSQDLSDALIDGVRGMFNAADTASDEFKKRFTNLFKDLKNVLVNFVLFDPLKNFVTDKLSGALSGQFAPKQANARLAQTEINTSDVLDRSYEIVDSLVDKINVDSLETASAAMNNTSVNLNGAAGALSGAASDLSAAVNGQAPGLGAATMGAGSPLAAAGATGASLAVAAVLKNPSAYVPEATQKANESQSETTQGKEVTVQGYGSPEAVRTQRDYFSRLKNVFDSTANRQQLKSGFGDIKDAFGKGGSFSSKLDSVGKGISKVAGVATKAFAAYEVGSGVAKALGLGKGGQRIAGGASAGFSVAGPIGGLIGAGLGAASLLFKKTKYANAAVTVGDSGRAGVGTVNNRRLGAEELEAIRGSASQGSGAFNSLANDLGATLAAGNYGVFGKADQKGPDNFYSATGSINRYGRPNGVNGVDFLKSDNADELQAFALKKQLQAGKFQGLDPVYQTIANNTKANSTADLSSDLQVGKGYLDFVDSAMKGSDAAKQVAALTKNFDALKRSSAALGLDTAKLTRAYQVQLKTMREDFNFDINQEILQIQNPIQAAYNALIKDYENAVGNAQAVGGDLAAVEKLYGLKRAEILKQTSETGVDSLKNAAEDMLRSLTSSTSSPLSSLTTFSNAQKDFRDLKAEFAAGNYTNMDSLQERANNYLDTGRNIDKSSADYFTTYNEVTDFLKNLATNGMGLPSAPVPVSELPELPAVNTIVDKLSKQNDELLGVNRSIGSAIVDGNSEVSDLLSQINANLQKVLYAPGVVPSSGVLSTGALTGYRVAGGVALQ